LKLYKRLHVLKILNSTQQIIFSRLKLNIMKTTFFTRLLAGSLITATFFTACSKNGTIDELNNGPQQTTTAAKGIAVIENPNILNQELVVAYASDGGADITQQFNQLTFKFAGNYPSGQAEVWNDLLARIGTWNMANESSITISYPTDPFTQLAYLNREWTIGVANRGFIVFTAADGDEVHFISKTQ
jgi:hypothetical protein